MGCFTTLKSAFFVIHAQRSAGLHFPGSCSFLISEFLLKGFTVHILVSWRIVANGRGSLFYNVRQSLYFLAYKSFVPST